MTAVDGRKVESHFDCSIDGINYSNRSFFVTSEGLLSPSPDLAQGICVSTQLTPVLEFSRYILSQRTEDQSHRAWIPGTVAEKCVSTRGVTVGGFGTVHYEAPVWGCS